MGEHPPTWNCIACIYTTRDWSGTSRKFWLDSLVQEYLKFNNTLSFIQTLTALNIYALTIISHSKDIHVQYNRCTLQYDLVYHNNAINHARLAKKISGHMKNNTHNYNGS
jgi:hypothetical protein